MAVQYSAQYALWSKSPDNQAFKHKHDDTNGNKPTSLKKRDRARLRRHEIKSSAINLYEITVTLLPSGHATASAASNGIAMAVGLTAAQVTGLRLVALATMARQVLRCALHAAPGRTASRVVRANALLML